MEDAHIAVSGLGDELDELSLFGVFDGHGGAEVAAFCKQFLPDEVRSSCGSGLEALTSSFHAMDDMLRSPEHERQLLALKQVARTTSKGIGGASSSSGSSSDSGSSSGSDSEAEEKDEGKKPHGVLSLLSNSIQSTLAQARDKGSLSREEAKQVMMKMALLRRLESKA
eukprot:CAMPEP_0181518722 /NCGR_PEP_ID=MMETSP1110-20121109/65411_1 /TAXON_ID=174948 /ORGANISM="Symbiodinium sp., Strain CCMP421" /LENGTH=167 /DNA_ID=CAMNT_0023649129 /DNA_START=86 /DNA_END=586 /DNA_ORIENTATION=-